MLFPVEIFRVRENSMLPAIKPGDYVIINTLCHKFFRPARGDIIVLKHPHNDLIIIKRVKSISKNGKLFVAGDNKRASEDSRKFGPVNLKDVIGKVVITI